jgi:thermostable 8-oxoguanine DNA glycosylase
VNQNWTIQREDVKQIRAFVDRHKENDFVVVRAKRNLRDAKPRVEKDDFWKQMVVCLLTTRQRSGPASPVTRLAKTRPFPLAYGKCVRQSDVRRYLTKILVDFGGIRFTNKIPKFVADNLQSLEDGFGRRTIAALERLRISQDQSTERKIAAFIRKNFWGFGPKQSRNLLQCLGLTKYEIPIDSRVTDQLAEWGFPIQLSLANESSYCRVLDDIQELCRACKIVPCILDAAIFAGKDGDPWADVTGVY